MNLRKLLKDAPLIEKRIAEKKSKEELRKKLEQTGSLVFPSHPTFPLYPDSKRRLLLSMHEYYSKSRHVRIDNRSFTISHSKIQDIETMNDDSLLILSLATKDKSTAFFNQVNFLLHNVTFYLAGISEPMYRHQFIKFPHPHSSFFYCEIEEAIHRAQKLVLNLGDQNE